MANTTIRNVKWFGKPIHFINGKNIKKLKYQSAIYRTPDALLGLWELKEFPGLGSKDGSTYYGIDCNIEFESNNVSYSKLTFYNEPMYDYICFNGDIIYNDVDQRFDSLTNRYIKITNADKLGKIERDYLIWWLAKNAEKKADDFKIPDKQYPSIFSIYQKDLPIYPIDENITIENLALGVTHTYSLYELYELNTYYLESLYDISSESPRAEELFIPLMEAADPNTAEGLLNFFVPDSIEEALLSAGYNKVNLKDIIVSNMFGLSSYNLTEVIGTDLLQDENTTITFKANEDYIDPKANYLVGCYDFSCNAFRIMTDLDYKYEIETHPDTLTISANITGCIDPDGDIPLVFILLRWYDK